MPSEIDLFVEYVNTNARYIELGTPATEAEIAAFETRYKVKLPADVRDYFLKINGIYIYGGFIAVEALNDWCLLTECTGYPSNYTKSLVTEPNNQFYFGHYDFSVWDWLIRLDADLSVATPVLLGLDGLDEIANDFSDFLQRLRLNNHHEWLFTY
jgi:hypothetical protein